mmetsp:Transcript_26015/g.55049  ORF Transcript_26015/g.55049 Transcript_26015/m.55049 type:complete len:243 (-) Transcript_26015:79-807(-)
MRPRSSSGDPWTESCDLDCVNPRCNPGVGPPDAGEALGLSPNSECRCDAPFEPARGSGLWCPTPASCSLGVTRRVVRQELVAVATVTAGAVPPALLSSLCTTLQTRRTLWPLLPALFALQGKRSDDDVCTAWPTCADCPACADCPSCAAFAACGTPPMAEASGGTGPTFSRTRSHRPPRICHRHCRSCPPGPFGAGTVTPAAAGAAVPPRSEAVAPWGMALLVRGPSCVATDVAPPGVMLLK